VTNEPKSSRPSTILIIFFVFFSFIASLIILYFYQKNLESKKTCEFAPCPSVPPTTEIPISGEFESSQPGELIGGQKDEHGCLLAAGYSWCEAKQKCLRTWEEKCD